MHTNTSETDALDMHINDLVTLCGIPTTSQSGPVEIQVPSCTVTETVKYGTRKSRIANNVVTSAGGQVIKEAMEAHTQDPALTGTKAFILLDVLGGAISDVPVEATAWVHRAGLYACQIGAVWSDLGPNPAAEAASSEWITTFYDTLDPYIQGGCYQGYWDPDVVNWPQMYYGSAYPRLRTVKSAYDPENFFRFQRSIPPA